MTELNHSDLGELISVLEIWISNNNFQLEMSEDTDDKAFYTKDNKDKQHILDKLISIKANLK